MGITHALGLSFDGSHGLRPEHVRNNDADRQYQISGRQMMALAITLKVAEAEWRGASPATPLGSWLAGLAGVSLYAPPLPDVFPRVSTSEQLLKSLNSLIELLEKQAKFRASNDSVAGVSDRNVGNLGAPVTGAPGQAVP